MDINVSYIATGEDSHDSLKKTTYEILRVLVLLFRTCVTFETRPVGKEDLIFAVDEQQSTSKKGRSPTLKDLLVALTASGLELEDLVKEQADLSLNQHRIDDCLEKYLPKNSDMYMYPTHNSQKLYAAQ